MPDQGRPSGPRGCPPGAEAEDESRPECASRSTVDHSGRCGHDVACGVQPWQRTTVDVEDLTVDRRPRATLGPEATAHELNGEVRGGVEGAERCGGAPGTIIMVATRRKLGNERPSIISSSVMTS